jgi:hypothetical protein
LREREEKIVLKKFEREREKGMAVAKNLMGDINHII